MRERRLSRLVAVVGVAGLAACSAGTPRSAESVQTPAAAPSLTSEPFGQVGGTPVSRYTLTNGRGTRVRILTYGGIIQSIETPDRAGHIDNVVLGFPTLDGYLTNTGPEKTYFGAIIGRYGNRIGQGAFRLNGTTYHVPVNNNGNSLHGGPVGFDQKVWQASPQNSGDSVGLKLQYVSPAGEMGFPGTLTTTVSYIPTKRTNCASTTTRAPTPRPWSTSPTTVTSTWPANPQWMFTARR